jgi:hypothetical protein
MTAMNPPLPASIEPYPPGPTTGDRRIGSAIFTGFFCWVVISLGFFGLKHLMEQRPQFVGHPISGTKAELVQESPQFVVRKVTDDVSVTKPVQPDSSVVRFEMKGRRDYRGLKTISDMSGQFRAVHTLANDSDDPLFVLFRGAHPHSDSRTGEGLVAGALRLEASVPGMQENLRDAWLWSGTLAPRSSLAITVSYEVGSLRGVTYRMREQQGYPVKHLQVTFQRQDLDAVQFESGDGTNVEAGNTITWERRDFMPPDFFSAHLVEGRSLFTSLGQLLEIGPVVSLLFLLAMLAAILTRQPLSTVQICTISAGYGLYFPLILYLSSRFSFAVALVAALLVPGILLVNYARWLVGARAGLVGGILFLAFYQLLPTLGAFAGWNRGMVLLALGVVTLWILIQLQNQALRRGAGPVAALALVAILFPSPRAQAAEVQMLVPVQLADTWREKKPESSLVAYGPAEYRVQQEATHFRIEVSLPLSVLKPSELPVMLFAAPIHLTANVLESDNPDFARLVTLTNRLGLLTEKPGRGSLRLSYRVAIENHEGKKRAQIPLLAVPSGNIRLDSPRPDLEILGGSVWSKNAAEQIVAYEIGVAGGELLTLEWREAGGGGTTITQGADQLYGIGVTRAQHLTVIHSDGSCTHFAEFDLPAQLAQDFHMRLPPEARLISASLNGTEIVAPLLDNQTFRLRLPNREALQTSHRLSFRLAYPTMRLGFLGQAQLALPELSQTAGTLEWVLMLPVGFETEVISSGLEKQGATPDLSRFGDYGRILKSQPHTSLAKNLAPPGAVTLNVKYRQLVAGFFEPRP